MLMSIGRGVHRGRLTGMSDIQAVSYHKRLDRTHLEGKKELANALNRRSSAPSNRTPLTRAGRTARDSI